MVGERVEDSDPLVKELTHANKLVGKRGESRDHGADANRLRRELRIKIL